MDVKKNNSENLPDKYFGLKDVENFKKNFIDTNRGKPLFMIRFDNITGIDLLDFINLLRKQVNVILELEDIEFGFHYIDKKQTLLMGITPAKQWEVDKFPNIDNAVGRFHQECIRNSVASFNFGVSRTQSNFISDSEEIYTELFQASQKNLNDNLVRWSWTYYNKANTYISGNIHEAMIQPTVVFDSKKKTFHVKGGEVFVGGGAYEGYKQLINDIPPDQDLNRIELLILEKLVIACEKAKGLLKFNISPQSLIDTFSSHEKVIRLHSLIRSMGMSAQNIRFELVEKPYEETEFLLKDVCKDFWSLGFSFAADDFGVKSQSHQIVLDLGQMIKEFKLDPISFKFKIEEDQTKFLDNLAFIDYCKRLADNREAAITAEAVEDVDTLKFLMEHQIFQFQANILFKKMPVRSYKEMYSEMQDIPENVIWEILGNTKLMQKQKEQGNIFLLAKEEKLIS
jgi:EAL domain-containing protein (putative c-di-GMP-specific phosphodiesterase class I)